VARKIKICIEDGCHNAQTTKEFCRLHYLKNWRELKSEERRKAAKRLNRYVEGIMRRSPEASQRGREGDTDGTVTEKSDNISEDIGYSDPESLDEIISNLKIEH